MKKKLFRERRNAGFEYYLDENGNVETLRESLEKAGIKVKVAEPNEFPNRKTRRSNKKVDK